MTFASWSSVVVGCAILASSILACHGSTWRLVSSSAPWPGRAGMASVTVNQSTICFVGGSTSTGTSFDDVWCSADRGKSWHEKTPEFPGGARSNARMENVGNEVLLFGGAGGQSFNDVWASHDLISWDRRNAQAPWSGRGSLASAVIGEKLFVVGGIYYYSSTWVHFNDVWMSTDAGSHWSQVAAKAPWQARGGHSLSVVDGSVLLLAGGAYFAGPNHTEQLLSDVWTSKDEGQTWQLVTGRASWGPRGYHKTNVYGKAIFLYGGFNGSYLNDVWSSSDLGANWVQVRNENAWSRRENFAVEVVSGSPRSLVVFGGTDWHSNFNDAWSMDLADPGMVTLNNGVKMPIFSLGTAEYNGSQLENLIVGAVGLGMRSVDTAINYGNQQNVGHALKTVGRSQVFVITKTFPCVSLAPYNISDPLECEKRTREQVETDFAELGVATIDLLLLHGPNRYGAGACDAKACALNSVQWAVYEEFLKSGRVKAIGVSNYCPSCLSCILSPGRVVPAINQVQFHVGMTADPQGLLSFSARQGILPMAYSPMGHSQPPFMQAIADKYNKSTVQLGLKWIADKGYPMAVASSKLEHLKSDMDLFSWSLTKAETAEIDAYSRGDDVPSWACSDTKENAPADMLSFV